MKTFKEISGVRCRIETDENDFIDVYIEDDQKLLPEYLVRGAIDLNTAYLKARWAINERLAGNFIIHDCEGRMFTYPAPPNLQGSEVGTGNDWLQLS